MWGQRSGQLDIQKYLLGAFFLSKFINNIMDLRNKNILLVDDIFTTGSTVNEISKILKINGVNKVFVATFLTRADTFYVKG